jgi:hypothetical protein
VISQFQSINQSSLIDKLTDVKSMLDSLSVDDYTDQIESINESIDFDMNGPLNQLQTAVNLALDSQNEVEKAQRLIGNLNRLLVTHLPILLQSINASSMNSLFNQGGLNAMIDQLLRLIDQSTLLIDSPEYIEPTNLVNSLIDSDMRQYIDRLSTNQSIKYGSIYFFASLVIDDQLIDLNDQNIVPYRYDVDINGKRYANDRYCLTDDLH